MSNNCDLVTSNYSILNIKNFISEFEAKEKLIRQVGAVYIDNSKHSK